MHCILVHYSTEITLGYSFIIACLYRYVISLNFLNFDIADVEETSRIFH